MTSLRRMGRVLPRVRVVCAPPSSIGLVRRYGAAKKILVQLYTEGRKEENIKHKRVWVLVGLIYLLN